MSTEAQPDVSVDKKTDTINSLDDYFNDLGIPLYPNVQPTKGSTIIPGAKNATTQDLESIILYSKDPIEKAIDFYQQQLHNENAKIMNFNLPGRHMTMFLFKKANVSWTIHLIDNTEKDGTNIQIMKTLN